MKGHRCFCLILLTLQKYSREENFVSGALHLKRAVRIWQPPGVTKVRDREGQCRWGSNRILVDALVQAAANTAQVPAPYPVPFQSLTPASRNTQSILGAQGRGSAE